MASNLFDSDYLYGFHDPGGESLMVEMGRPGWIVFSHVVGCDPADQSGFDFRPYSAQGLGVICRINHGHAPDGTLPHSSQYEHFARRAANFVAASQGCHIWVIGNEPNYAVERPGVKIDWARHRTLQADSPENADPLRRGLVVRFNIMPDHSTEIRTTRGAMVSPGEVITPELYARCYRLCRDAIHRVSGHAHDQVLVAPVAPWNSQTIYPGNANGDWIQYFHDVLELLGRNHCDGFALHAYSHGSDATLVTSEERLAPPFQALHSQFRVYIDFMQAVPESMRGLAAYITEAGQAGPWPRENQGWIEAAYAEIDRWNRESGNQKIRAVALYRWPKLDRWHIEGKMGTVEDFQNALLPGYRWANRPRPDVPLPAELEQRGPGRTTTSDRPDAQSPADARLGDRDEADAPVDSGWGIDRGTEEGQDESGDAQNPTGAPFWDDDDLYPETDRGTETSRADDEDAAPNMGAAAEPRSGREHRAARKKSPETPEYAVQWINDHLPKRMLAGQVVSLPLELKNTGQLTWRFDGGNPFRVGYHYYRNRRRLALGSEKEIRTDIPHHVEPGETVEVSIRLALPDQPGNYTLEIDLIHEGVAWFKEQGSPVLSRWITVEAAPYVESADGDGESSNLPVPLFADVTHLLPKAGIPYARRDTRQVRYLVISHTGANPRVGLERIARTHVRYGYPGIVYDFIVDAAGQVFKVKNLEDVAQPEQPWSEQGVNICLTGNFTTDAPPLSQIDATGRLCAWLAQTLGLTPDAIIGMGELTRTRSPGASFYHGPQWKGILARQVRLHLAALHSSTDPTKVQELSVTVEELTQRTQELQNQVKRLQDERSELDVLNLRLQNELIEMQEIVEAQVTESQAAPSQGAASQVADGPGGLQIERLIEQLPRDDTRYKTRRAQDIRFVVINHTGIDPATPLVDIAEAHLPDWPGVLYDYFIDAEGRIFQTQPLDEVVDTGEEYLANAINIGFAGNFDRQIPTDNQLIAGCRLIAWLMERFPQLRTEYIRGVSEFIDHPSPGRQWQEGQSWKNLLIAGVRRTRGLVEASDVENQLRARLAEVEVQMQSVLRTKQELEDEVEDVRAENEKLAAQLSERQVEAKIYVVPQPAMRTIIEQLPRHPTLRYDRRNLSQISHLAIHHTATPPTIGPNRIAELHVAPDSSRGKEAWPGIGYHYFIHADGTIDQTNQLEMASFHVFRHNLHSVGIVFAGSFMNGKIPTSAQLRSGGHLVAWLMQELNIPLARVWGHREFPDNGTVCPGSEWTLGNRWRDLFFERIEQTQMGMGVKSIRHYMLFWQRNYPGPLARQDFVNAIHYVVRFRPAVGFSMQDARNAEYVTIVGNEAGISAGDEATLRNSGCKVERIAGRDEEETGRILADLASQGRRFRSFEVDF